MAKGTFVVDSGSVVMTGDPATSGIQISINASTVNTLNVKRDDHLKSAEYFDVQKFPSIGFVSKSIVKSEEGDYAYKAIGTLTIKGFSKEVELPFNYLGSMDTEYGKVYSFSGSLKIDRTQFGVGEKSQAVGSEVTIDFTAEASEGK
jgi:polyisoprenoid-binding protein YceI